MIEINNIDDRTYDLLFSINRSHRYHTHRRRFYELWNSWTITLSTIGGSVAFAGALAHAPYTLAAVSAGLVAVTSAIDLGFGTARAANTHAELAREFITLEQSFSHGKSLDDDEYERVVNKRLSIEMKEPPVLRLLDVICHYELLRALGEEKKPPKIPWRRRVLANWLSQLAYTQHLQEPEQA